MDQRSLADFETAALDRRIEALALERSLGETEITLTVELGLGLPADPHRPEGLMSRRLIAWTTCVGMSAAIAVAIVLVSARADDAPDTNTSVLVTLTKLERVASRMSSSAMGRWRLRQQATRPSWLP